jgi:hypothetical protein
MPTTRFTRFAATNGADSSRARSRIGWTVRLSCRRKRAASDRLIETASAARRIERLEKL